MWSRTPGKRPVLTVGLAVVGLAVVLGYLSACSTTRRLAWWRPPAPDFLIIGHRGAPNQACENTLESFAEALNRGANALELDISMTRDAQLVLWHDWVYSVENGLRPTGACDLVRPALHPPVHTVSLAEFMRDYGYERHGQRLPVTTFTQFVQRFASDKRARTFFLDLKIPADQPELVAPLFQRAAQTLSRHRALSKAVFLTPYESIFSRLHAEARDWQRTTGSRVDVAFDMEGPQVLHLGEWPSTVRQNHAAGARFALWGEPVVSVQPSRDFLLTELQRRDAINSQRAPRARMRLIVWTINDVDDLCEMIGLGVDGIMTDEPERLHSLVRHWGRPGHCAASSPLASQREERRRSNVLTSQ